MKIPLSFARQHQQGSILVYFILLLIVITAVASVSAYVAQTTNIERRRSDMISAREYAESGAAIAATDLNSAYIRTNTSPPFPQNLHNLITSYTLNSSLSTNQISVYERTISAPFATNQTAKAQIWVTNSPIFPTAKIVSTATVGNVTQTATLNVQTVFGYGAAILSVNDGTIETGGGKGAAQVGNVVVSGGGVNCILVVDGGTGLAVQANGSVNIASTANVPASSVSSNNFNTANQIPDYTGQGTANSLFDFNRFIAVADLTPNAYNTNAAHNNHFTNVNSFAHAMSVAPNHTLEGVVVVDLHNSSLPKDPNWSKAGDKNTFPNGINIHGTLFYNFGPEFGPTDKFVVDADLNVNPAILTGLVPTNRTTYASGYPPVYTDNTKNPTNINTMLNVPPYPKFNPTDDLPALMYSIGEVDIHGNADVCGVSYTPSYMEIENKTSGNHQYFKGMLIMGQGIYLENNSSAAVTIITYDKKTLDNLATVNNRGRIITVAYWQ